MSDTPEFDSNELLLAGVLNSLVDAFAIFDNDLRFMWVNKMFERLSGKQKEDLIGKSLWETFHEAAEPDSIHWINYQKAIRSKKPQDYKFYTERNNRWTGVSIYPNDDNIAVLIWDATSEVQSEQAVKESEGRLRAIVTASSDIIFRASPDWSTALHIEGRGKIADVLEPEKNWLQNNIHPDDLENMENSVQRGIETKSMTEIKHRIVLSDGTIGWMSSRAVPILDDDGNIVEWFGTARDVTRRRNAEEQLRLTREESERKKNFYESITNSTPDLIYSYDTDHRFTFANKALLTLLGKTMDEVRGKSNRELGYPEWQVYEKEDSDFHTVLETKKSVRGTYTTPRKNIGDRTYDCIFMPVFDEQGNIREVAGISRDITDIKKAEEEIRHQHAAEQRTKLLIDQRNALIKINRTKDEFISLASHQLRTPATAVKQYTGMLLDEMAGTLTDRQAAFVRIAYESNERELTIINDLLKTAQIDSKSYVLSTESYNIVSLLKEAIADLDVTCKQRGQKVQLIGSRKRIELNIDPTELKLAFSNLLENASKYSHHGTTIVVTVDSTDTTVEISVTDKGVGIAPENHLKVFDKFTRVDNELSAAVTGTGLGLYWVKQIAKMHGGSVELDSTPGQGSTFRMKLPRAAK